LSKHLLLVNFLETYWSKVKNCTGLSFAGSRIFLYNNIDSILKFQCHTFITFRILKDDIVIMKKALNKILIRLS
jgi:hypothetical protein